MTETLSDTRQDTTRRDALADRLFEATIGTLEVYSVYLGTRLGFYGILEQGACSPKQLAERAGVDVRYAREWLEQQAVAGFLDVAADAVDPDDRSFALPADHAEVLADATSPTYLGSMSLALAGIGQVLPEVVEAYRSGTGVPYRQYGEDFRHGQAAANRPAFTHEMAGWLAAVPGLGTPGRIADVGCGLGWSTLALARAVPGAEVTGYDLDDASIVEARALAAGTDVADRVSYATRDASSLEDDGPFDLITVFEALHDMAAPVDALAACRAALAEGGSVLLVDERVAHTFCPPGDEVERMMYGWSVSHCLPASREEEPSAALGTVLREPTVRDLAADAGFCSVEVLPIENDVFRFYRLRA